MKDLPLTARIYIFLLVLGAIGVVSYSAFLIQYDLTLWLAVLIVGAAVMALDFVPIMIYGASIEMTISTAVKFAAVLLFPPPVAILATFVGTLAGEVPAARVWYKKLFNISQMTIAIAVVGWIYFTLNQPQVDFFGSLQNVFAVTVAGLAVFIFNSTLVSLAVSFALRSPFRHIWSQNFPKVIWHDLSMIPLGAFLAVLWRYNPLSIPLAALPLVVVRHSYETANQLQRQTHDALRALMRVIDARDQRTFDHSERVSNYAKLIAGALNLSQEEIEVIESAALLHDLGKVGMVDELLFNPEHLNSDEHKKAQRHAEIGAELLSKFPLFEKGAVLVYHHHERYDGKGYPDGLKGEEIPLGARIISVADAYQAMTENRPYRRALSEEAAISELIKGSGSQFDPSVVQAFLKILPRSTAQEMPAIPTTPSVVKASSQ